MKQKLKHIFKAFVLCVIVFFTSCNQDEIYENDNLSKTSRYISFNELKQNRAAFNEFQKIESKINSAKESRLVYLSQFNFSIDTDKILLIENGDYKSYTFPIYRDSLTDKTENFILTIKNNEINTYLSKYALTDLEKIKIENYQYVDLTNKIEFSKLEYETNDEGPCYGPVQSIPLEWNELGQVTVSFFYMEEVPCPDGGSGGTGGNNGGYAGWGGWGDWSGWTSGGTGTGTGGTGTGTGGTGTGTSGTNTGGDPLSEWDGTSIVTYPVIGDGVIIENLNQLTNRPEVKGRITELLGLVSTIQLEHGSEFFTDDDNPTLPLIREDLTPTFSGIIFNSPYSNSLIRLHSHHDPALEPTFSSEDIAGMAIFYRDVKNLGSLEAENVTSILASNLGLYALRITSPQKATLFAQRLDVASYYDQFKLNYGLKVQNKAKDACSCSENNDAYQQFLLNYFIDFLADQDTGISIFTGTINPDGSITWTRT